MTTTIARRVTGWPWPLALAVAAVLAQIAYPLTPAGQPRHALTVVTVVVFAAASVTHAAVWRGPRFALRLVAVTAGGGLVVEAVGVATGWPFGAYTYTGSLGWGLLGVPVVIPLAWTMMAYPALIAAERLAGSHVLRPLVAGWALASWDLFLDPQMVDAGHWTWQAGPGPALLGVPLTNFAAWLIVATVMMLLLRRPPAGGDDRVPLGLYLWTYASSVLAHAVFFGLPGSALAGGLGMGVIAVPLALRLYRAGR